MLNEIKSMLREHGIALSAPVPLSRCHITKPYLLERAEIPLAGTAVMFAVPYYTTKHEDCASNISAYAVSRDYHLFFKELFAKILPRLQERFPTHRFAGFTDHSPIDEPHAASAAGLGFMGCHHLFLTREHSSFVFLGEIVTDAPFDVPQAPPQSCLQCGACQKSCPVSLDIGRCHSALTQKKGELNEQETEAILAHGSAWGCDICQQACPITKQAREAGTLYSKIPFFCEDAIPHLSAQTIRNMSDEAFAARAYSWRGRKTILRNLEILEKGRKS